jgi:putative transposase
MTALEIVNGTAGLQEQIAEASPDVLRTMVQAFAEALMSAEADTLCGAPYGARSEERVNSRNGYRSREWDTRAGTIDLAIPKLRHGSYFPDWLLQHRRRAEQALVSVVATSYLLGVSTRRVEKLVEQLGVKSLSKSQVSEMAAHLDAQVEAFRNRPLDSGHYTFVWMDALVVKVREHGRTVNVHTLVAVGVNADGQREVLGVDVASDEDGAGWLAFLRSLTARGLSGVRLVISDAHRGLVSAIGAALPGASWQRCRTHWSCIESSWRVETDCLPQCSGGVVAGIGGCGLVSGLVQQRSDVDQDVADGAGADVEQVGQDLPGAGSPVVEDRGEDPFWAGEFLLEYAAAGAGQAVSAAAVVAAVFNFSVVR